MRGVARFWVFAGITFLTLSGVASANCRLYLAQSSSFSLSLKTPNVKPPKNSSNACAYEEIELELLAGNASLKIKPGRSWQLGTPYTATAVLTNGPVTSVAGNTQFLTLSSASTTESRSMTAMFTAASGQIAASLEEDAPNATADFVVRQQSLTLSGMQALTLRPNGSNFVPIELVQLAGGPAPWLTVLPPSGAAGTLTVTAVFQLDAAEPIPLKAYIDTYGQAIKASWPGKVSSQQDLNAAVAAERTWLSANKGPANVDAYGGITGGWTDTPMGYYYADQHNGRWFLISPLGNPLFYVGVTSVAPYSTPGTPSDTRGVYFDSFPPAGPPDFKAAYSSKSTLFSFAVANQLRKYCTTDENSCLPPFPAPAGAACTTPKCTLTQLSSDLETVRFASWAFSGEGKFFSQESLMQNPLLPHPSFPVLEHDVSKLPMGWPGVQNLVSHPDPFDSQTMKDLDTALQMQIGSHVNDPNVVGWSMGNEKDEIIEGTEIDAILQMAAKVPAKQSLMLHALNVLYKGSYSALNAAWGISATTQPQLFDAAPVKIPTLDQEKLRQFYEDAYYGLFRARVKSMDHHHLYFGSWILPGDSTLESDWPIAARYSDVVGFDDFSPGPLSTDLIQLFATTPDKPVLLGAWGVPADYGGARGFGWNQYTNSMTLSDSASGDAYGAKLASLAANTNVVGAMMFDYYDEPLTGRGGSGMPGDLVLGEDFAFGLLDTTDTPKYDLVNKVRAANCSVVATLGLGSCPK